MKFLYIKIRLLWRPGKRNKMIGLHENDYFWGIKIKDLKIITNLRFC